MQAKVFYCLSTALALSYWMPMGVLGAAIDFNTIQSRGVPTAGQPVTGDATFFTPGVGACGQTNAATDSIVALSTSDFSDTLCGKQIAVTNTQNQKSVTVTIVDKCEGCVSGSIDLSSGAFTQIADQAAGRVPVQWTLQ